MAGNAITNQFNIGTATVMVGRPEEVLNLTPEQHSIGLVKAVSLTSETNEVSLTQGIRNKTVDSQVTGVTSTVTAEVYEYTAANLAYATQLDGANYTTGSAFKLATAVTGGESATTLTLDAESDASSQFVEGTIIELQATGSKKYDKVFLAKVASSSYTSNKLTITLKQPIPAGWTFEQGDSVYSVSAIPVGSEEPQPYVGVKIVGILPNGNEPITIILPKAKITSGISLAFNTDNYGNIPFEFTPYDLTVDDELYEEFKQYSSNVIVYKR